MSGFGIRTLLGYLAFVAGFALSVVGIVHRVRSDRNRGRRLVDKIMASKANDWRYLLGSGLMLLGSYLLFGTLNP